MIVPQAFGAAIEAALADVRDRLRDRLAEIVPADVAVTVSGDGVALTGVALAVRSLDDPRLRDLAGLVR